MLKKNPANLMILPCYHVITSITTTTMVKACHRGFLQEPPISEYKLDIPISYPDVCIYNKFCFSFLFF